MRKRKLKGRDIALAGLGSLVLFVSDGARAAKENSAMLPSDPVVYQNDFYENYDPSWALQVTTANGYLVQGLQFEPNPDGFNAHAIAVDVDYQPIHDFGVLALGGSLQFIRPLMEQVKGSHRQWSLRGPLEPEQPTRPGFLETNLLFPLAAIKSIG